MFSLNLTNSVTKYLSYSKIAQTSQPLTSCVRDQDAITVLACTHVRDSIFKLSPIHASVIYQIP